jgi:hypothetical protein
MWVWWIVFSAKQSIHEEAIRNKASEGTGFGLVQSPTFRLPISRPSLKAELALPEK